MSDSTFTYSRGMLGEIIRSDGVILAAINVDDPNWVAYQAWAQTHTAPMSWDAYQALALAAIKDSDLQMLRIMEAVTLAQTSLTDPAVVAWVTYRRALRVILRQTSGDTTAALPQQPAYVAGT